MTRRHVTTAVTLLVLVAILVLGVTFGAKKLFEPLPGDNAAATATPSPTCSTKTVRKGQRIRSRQVQVSVFNGGTRSGLADSTMAMLRARDFTAGSIGNAPDDVKAKRVRVFTTEKGDLAAQLVARQFGRRTKVTVTDKDLGPGIDVVVGNSFDQLSPARHVIVVKKSSSVCVPVPSASPGTS
ncbi:MAG: LytR C-terminal domain-containing protein [Nocardioidaceae bacterium]